MAICTLERTAQQGCPADTGTGTEASNSTHRDHFGRQRRATFSCLVLTTIVTKPFYETSIIKLKFD